ncbi:uncharacterized protein BO66DRAFT_431827 [Aspergillus aculeatinus CBS 121060]|uniref:Uncharacterized protein n=1 Tax=Aspergillus aculeatinus CBS 121060 TaxID=1448322 RepID=A0ACD1GWH2_9EURO|nr:hypothetical protein BO66DRAFT_431827 [Aspergillus aculeatinus CBS 121060]RAH65695.1 hypothetical protein BO66DRAFT_431827 [Aspergillus aculeatinus CBS 121060]
MSNYMPCVLPFLWHVMCRREVAGRDPRIVYAYSLIWTRTDMPVMRTPVFVEYSLPHGNYRYQCNPCASPRSSRSGISPYNRGALTILAWLVIGSKHRTPLSTVPLVSLGSTVDRLVIAAELRTLVQSRDPDRECSTVPISESVSSIQINRALRYPMLKHSPRKKPAHPARFTVS